MDRYRAGTTGEIFGATVTVGAHRDPTHRSNGSDAHRCMSVHINTTKYLRGTTASINGRRIGMGNDVDQQGPATQRLARITGILYLVIAILGMFAGIVSEIVVVAGDAAATAENVLASLALFRGGLVAWIVVLVADVAVAVTFFVPLRPVNATLSLLAAAFRVV